MKITRKILERIINEEVGKVLRNEAQLVVPPMPPLAIAARILLSLKLISAAAAVGFGVGTALDKATGASDKIAKSLSADPNADAPSNKISARDVLIQMAHKDGEKLRKGAMLLARNLEKHYNENAGKHPGNFPYYREFKERTEAGDIVDHMINMRKEVLRLNPEGNGSLYE